MSGLLAGTILSLTVLTVLTLGIFAAYATVNAVLSLFARRTTERRGTPVLIPSQNPVGGD